MQENGETCHSVESLDTGNTAPASAYSCIAVPIDHTQTFKDDIDKKVNVGKGQQVKLKKVEFVNMENDSPDEFSKENSNHVNSRNKHPINNSRLHQKRMSLLGKPIEYKLHKWGICYRKIQAKIYNFLERPKYWTEISYHIATFILVLSCIVISIFASIPSFGISAKVLLYVELGMLAWLSIEYGIRMWSAGCRSRYQKYYGRLKFAFRPLCIIDTIVIFSSMCLMAISASRSSLFLSALQGLRFFQIVRLIRMDRRGNMWKLLGSVIWAHRQELLTSAYMALIGLLLSSFLLHLAEKDSNPKFHTLADSMWWGVITLVTVGYGDTVPVTWPGKLIAGMAAACFISFFALPAGILGSGFALKVQQQQRQKHQIRRRIPAAVLIQSLWKCYAADKNSLSVATWKPHMKPCPSPTQEQSRLKHQSSFVSRFSSRRGKDKEKMNGIQSMPTSPRSTRTRKDGVAIPMPDDCDIFNKSHLNLTIGEKDAIVPAVTRSQRDKKDSLEKEEDELLEITQLTEVHKSAIRALRKISYYVARKKFREALRPYDVKDVMEQYSSGHADMLARVKTLQVRLDQILGKSGSKAQDVYESKLSLASRIVGVERKVEDIDTKLDLLLELYQEERQGQRSGMSSSDPNTPTHYFNPGFKLKKHVTYHGEKSKPTRTYSSPADITTENITIIPTTILIDHGSTEDDELSEESSSTGTLTKTEDDEEGDNLEAEPLLRPEVLKLRKLAN